MSKHELIFELPKMAPVYDVGEGETLAIKNGYEAHIANLDTGADVEPGNEVYTACIHHDDGNTFEVDWQESAPIH